ncbi:hypothetical protein BFP72_09140 [Reichenbachiella sp. 5M10]|uniref:hypothetical protein n=1 Tax=Reichenbachiella sp. 5M10 TaxID=1889772 RepID=UPI000C153795|nr:hypothetical protein [Reichenbachiella sp. 5M10]PIB35543.1 hypothetical protein BFP72_09140 [Reichenbachiella sp. 5M10]
MRTTLFKLILLFGLGFLLNSCYYDEVPEFDQGEIEGYKPIYGEEQLQIEITDPVDFENPRNIYKYQHFIFISELGDGFHILDNTDPTSPKNIGFFNIPMNQNIAAKGNVVYADSGQDLLALSINAEESIEVRRIEGVFGGDDQIDLTIFPPEPGYYFDCVEDEKGIVIGWEKSVLSNPKCYY